MNYLQKKELFISNGNVFLIYTFQSVTKHDRYLRYCFNWCSYFYLPIVWLTVWTVHVNMKSFPALEFGTLAQNLVVHSVSHVQLLVKLWISACKPCLSFTISWSFFKFMSISWWWHPTVSASVAPSPPAHSLSQHQSLFQWVSFSQQVAKVLELQHQSF